MIGIVTRTVIYMYGGYNSDEHLSICVTVKKDGYDITSEADSIYNKSLTGSQCHVPFGFFSRSPDTIVKDLEKKGIIPDDFAGAKIKLHREEAYELYQFDRNRKGRI